jgi:hypothetical protein
VSKAEWIEVKSIQNPGGLLSAQRKYGAAGSRREVTTCVPCIAVPFLKPTALARTRNRTCGFGRSSLLRFPRFYQLDFRVPRHSSLIRRWISRVKRRGQLSTGVSAFDDEPLCRYNYIECGFSDDPPCNCRQKKKPTTPTGTNVPAAISLWRAPAPSQVIKFLWFIETPSRNKNVTENRR